MTMTMLDGTLSVIANDADEDGTPHWKFRVDERDMWSSVSFDTYDEAHCARVGAIREWVTENTSRPPSGYGANVNPRGIAVAMTISEAQHQLAMALDSVHDTATREDLARLIRFLGAAYVHEITRLPMEERMFTRAEVNDLIAEAIVDAMNAGTVVADV